MSLNWLSFEEKLQVLLQSVWVDWCVLFFPYTFFFWNFVNCFPCERGRGYSSQRVDHHHIAARYGCTCDQNKLGDEESNAVRGVTRKPRRESKVKSLFVSFLPPERFVIAFFVFLCIPGDLFSFFIDFLFCFVSPSSLFSCRVLVLPLLHADAKGDCRLEWRDHHWMTRSIQHYDSEGAADGDGPWVRKRPQTQCARQPWWRNRLVSQDDDDDDNDDDGQREMTTKKRRIQKRKQHGNIKRMKRKKEKNKNGHPCVVRAIEHALDEHKICSFIFHFLNCWCL